MTLKVIPGQKISSVSSTSENGNYPDDNVLDEHPKKLWKAANGVDSATLTFSIDGGTGGMAVFNTNATAISASITDPNAVSWESGVEWESGVQWVTSDPALTETVSLDGESGAAFFEWVHTDNVLTATLDLTGVVGETLKMGVAVSDQRYEYNSPQFGVQEGLVSYSIVRELNNGAFYRKERDKVRRFNFAVVEDRAVDFYEFMYTVAKPRGYKPAAWQIHDSNGFNWVVYARFEELPSGQHMQADLVPITARLIEVL